MSFAILYCFIASSAVPSAQFLLSTDSPVSRLHAFDFTQANETAVGKIATELSIFVMQSVDGAPCVNVCTGIHPDLTSNPFHWKEDLSGAARSLSLFLYPFSLSFTSSMVLSLMSVLSFTALCIFHIGFAFMFHLRQLKGEQLCGP